MSRWYLLKSAVAGKRDCSNESSIHKFNGFQLVNRRKVIWKGYEFVADNVISSSSLRDSALLFLESIDTCACCMKLPYSLQVQAIVEDGMRQGYWREVSNCDDFILVEVKHPTFQPNMKSCSYYEHIIPVDGTDLKLYTREKPKDSGLSAAALLSNKVHNVDNTGNICIWPAESILLHSLLNNVKYSSWLLESRRIIELGGGLTALAGLGVASWCARLNDGVKREVVVTDGHPDCVVNQNVCIEMCQQKQSLPRDSSIKSQLLHWSVESNNDTLSLLTKNGESLFDLIIASDCLFFRDFHYDLIHTILRLLSSTGRVMLLQPQRDGTLSLFVEKCSEYFDVQRDDYSEIVLRMREEYKAASATNGYNDDVHYPIMLVLTKKTTTGVVAATKGVIDKDCY